MSEIANVGSHLSANGHVPHANSFGIYKDRNISLNSQIA